MLSPAYIIHEYEVDFDYTIQKIEKQVEIYPKATSRAIITINPTEKESTPASE